MTDIPLPSPPTYDYQTSGPWFIAHITDGRPQAWIMQVFDSAILRFWLAAGQIPDRRVMVDAYGVTVMATRSFSVDDARMSGTRQTMDATIKLVEQGSGAVEDHAIVLTMVEAVRSMDGQAL